MNESTQDVFTVKEKQIGKLAKALCKVQGELSAATKDGNNPHFRSKFATLQSVWDVARQPLSNNGLSVSQLVQDNSLKTILLHESGEYLESTMPLKVDKNTMQGLGSAITYARRYSFSSIVGVCVDEDDDGNKASAGQGYSKPQNTPVRTQTVQPQTNTYVVSEKQLKRLFAIQKTASWSDDQVKLVIKKHWDLDSRSQLNKTKYDWLCNKIETATFDDTLNPPKIVNAPTPSRQTYNINSGEYGPAGGQ